MTFSYRRNDVRWPFGAQKKGAERRKLRLETLEPRHLLTVVINEVLYNSDDNTSREEFVELYNTGATAVDLSGWAFTSGISYTFQPGQQIAAGGYLVIAEDPATILAEFGQPSIGPFEGKLSNEGERIELSNAQGVVIDSVEYLVGFPWPVAPGGGGGSMELINPSLDNNLPGSWRASYVTPMFASSAVGDLPEPAQGLSDLVHRWGFNGNLIDSVGGAHGVLVDPSGIASFGGGQLNLSGNNNSTGSNQSPFTNGAYIDLPNDIISDLGDDATFEWWGTVSTNRPWAEIFSFGRSTGPEGTAFGAANQEYITLIPQAETGGGPLRVTHRNGSTAQESAANGTGSLSTGVQHHIAVTWNGTTNQQRLYLNGVFVASSNTIIDLSQIEDINNWLGRSQWPDPLFDGFFNEFRIYNRPLSDAEVMESYGDGPDAVLAGPTINSFTTSNEEILLGASATLMWSVTDADTLMLSDGVNSINVTGQTQRVVSPSQNTTYTLTATNGDGVSTRTLTQGVKTPRATPGAQNLVFAANAPPNVEEVQHPADPQSGQSATVTAEVNDPNGVGSVVLQYQVVLPGAYIPSTLPVPLDALIANGELLPTPNPAYFDQANWLNVAMTDNGLGADAVAGDGVYSASIPAQDHRTLVRYRMVATDTLGASATVPYADDASLNFAFFVYDGVPDYTDNFGNVLADSATINSVPVYHFLTRAQDMEDVLAYDGSDEIPQFSEARFTYNWAGTMVYNGKVYDNISYRLRGANGRYQFDGKRSMRFRFNDGSYFEMLDQDGVPYPEKIKTLTTGKGFENRGTLTYSLNEAVTMQISNMIGLPAADTHWFQFRVIDGAEEAPDQWRGDFWGLNFSLETYDKRFLDAHGLEAGNLYKLVNQRSEGLEQQRYQAPDAVDDGSDHDYIEDLLTRNSTDIEHRVNLDKYYLYHALVEAVRHYDFWPTANKNMVYYFEPDYLPENDYLGKLWILPFDTDATWGPTWNEGHDVVYDALFENNNVAYRNALISPDYYNIVRELRDLLWQPDQLEGMINELASAITPLEAADRARWQGAPNDAGNYNGIGGPGGTSIAALVQDMWNFAFVGGNWPGGSVQAGGRAAYLDQVLQQSGEEALIPFTPTITYTGDPGMAAGELQFQTSAFADPQGAGTFGAVQWRISQVTDAAAGADPNREFLDEWTASWDSGALGLQNNTIIPPAFAVTAGETHRARVRFQDNTGRWSHWSDPLEFTPSESSQSQLAVDFLRISEFNYHPHDGLPQFGETGAVGDEFEFIEFINTSPDQSIDLSGVQLAGGLTFTFPVGSNVAPGGRILVVDDIADFQSRYGSGLPVAGEWTGALSNSGEELIVFAADGGEVQRFTYADNWRPRTDGDGSSMEVVDTEGDYNSETNWRASAAFGGTPGVAPIDVLNVVVNEVVANPTSGTDSIELINISGAPVSIAGWWLSDGASNLFRYQIGAGTTLASGGIVVFNESQFNSGGGGFALSSEGEEVWVLAADANGRPWRFADVAQFDATLPGVALGRVPDGETSYGLFPLSAPTLGAANAAPLAPVVAISEVHYHPGAPPAGVTITEQQLEYLELYNNSGVSMNLSEWRIDGAADFVFPTGTMLGAGQTLVLVNFVPSNATLAGEFRSIHGIPPSVTLVGPLDGQLDNSGEDVRLLAPVAGATETVYYLVDRVVYDDASPWPNAADGQGPSLTRVSPEAFGDYASSWRAAAPTPGAAAYNFNLADFNLDGIVDQLDYQAWRTGFGKSIGVVKGDGDANNDGSVDAADYTVWRDNVGLSSLPSVAAVASAHAAVEPPAADQPPTDQSLAVSPLFFAASLSETQDTGPYGLSPQLSAQTAENTARPAARGRLLPAADRLATSQTDDQGAVGVVASSTTAGDAVDAHDQAFASLGADLSAWRPAVRRGAWAGR